MTKHIYKKIRTRSKEVLRSEICDTAERIVLPKLCENKVFYEPLLIYERNKGVSIYYNFTDLKQDPELIVNHFNNNKKHFFQLIEEFNKEKEIIINSNGNLKNLYNTLTSLWAKIAVFMALGEIRKDLADKDISDISFKMRSENDNIIYIALDKILKEAKELLPPEQKENHPLLTYEEIINNNFPSEKDLSKRKEAYIFFKGVIYTENLDEFCQKNSIEIEENKLKNKIIGNPAKEGKITGKARLILENSQLDKIREGDIIITPMTTPDFIPYLDKIKGIVTDEGGLLCHAAIIAREFNIPCIVGTENATSTIKDNDLIELNAYTGEVKII